MKEVGKTNPGLDEKLKELIGAVLVENKSDGRANIELSVVGEVTKVEKCLKVNDPADEVTQFVVPVPFRGEATVGKEEGLVYRAICWLEDLDRLAKLNFGSVSDALVSYFELAAGAGAAALGGAAVSGSTVLISKSVAAVPVDAAVPVIAALGEVAASVGAAVLGISAVANADAAVLGGAVSTGSAMLVSEFVAAILVVAAVPAIAVLGEVVALVSAAIPAAAVLGVSAAAGADAAALGDVVSTDGVDAALVSFKGCSAGVPVGSAGVPCVVSVSGGSGPVLAGFAGAVSTGVSFAGLEVAGSAEFVLAGFIAGSVVAPVDTGLVAVDLSVDGAKFAFPATSGPGAPAVMAGSVFFPFVCRLLCC
ncbi:hypothetical protein ACOSQ2_011950 [Xanthoceras sorbifolium]